MTYGEIKKLLDEGHILFTKSMHRPRVGGVYFVFLRLGEGFLPGRALLRDGKYVYRGSNTCGWRPFYFVDSGAEEWHPSGGWSDPVIFKGTLTEIELEYGEQL